MHPIFIRLFLLATFVLSWIKFHYSKLRIYYILYRGLVEGRLNPNSTNILVFVETSHGMRNLSRAFDSIIYLGWNLSNINLLLQMYDNRLDYSMINVIKFKSEPLNSPNKVIITLNKIDLCNKKITLPITYEYLINDNKNDINIMNVNSENSMIEWEDILFGEIPL